jgi:hypothetical protein
VSAKAATSSKQNLNNIGLSKFGNATAKKITANTWNDSVKTSMFEFKSDRRGEFPLLNAATKSD